MGANPTAYPNIISAHQLWQFLPVCLFVADQDSNIVEANDRMLKYFQLNRPCVAARQFGDMFGCYSIIKEKAACGEGSKCPVCPMQHAINSVISGSSVHYETELEHEYLINGRQSVKWFAVSASRMVHQDAVYAVIALTDISDGKKREKELVQLGITDALTGLYNRRFILQKLRNSLRSEDENTYPLSIVMLDIDNFKSVNDTFGHPVGDRVLSGLAGIFKKYTRDTDYAGRYGGEEFLLIFENSSAVCTQKVLARISDRFRRLLKGRALVPLTFSAGVIEVARGQAGETDAAALILKADQLLYEAKHKGKDQIVL